MDWSNERYVRVYTRDTTTWKLLDWQARTVLLHLFRKVDRAGVLEVGDDGVMGLAAMLELPIEFVEHAMPQLTRSRSAGVPPTLVKTRTAFVLPNFMDAQEAHQTDAQRQREARARRREKSMAPELPSTANGFVTTANGFVTDETDSGHNRHNASQPVTPSLADPILAKPNQPGELARAIPRGTGEVAVPRANGSEDPELTARRRLGYAIWDELNAARARVAKTLGIEAEPLDEHDYGKRDMADRILESGENAERRCRHVIRVTELEAATKGTVRWLSAGMFKPERWRNALAMTEQDVKPRDGPESTGPRVNPYSDDF